MVGGAEADTRHVLQNIFEASKTRPARENAQIYARESLG